VKEDIHLQLELRDDAGEVVKELLGFDVVLRVGEDGKYSHFELVNYDDGQEIVAVVDL